MARVIKRKEAMPHTTARWGDVYERDRPCPRRPEDWKEDEAPEKGVESPRRYRRNG